MGSATASFFALAGGLKVPDPTTPSSAAALRFLPDEVLVVAVVVVAVAVVVVMPTPVRMDNKEARADEVSSAATAEASAAEASAAFLFFDRAAPPPPRGPVTAFFFFADAPAARAEPEPSVTVFASLTPVAALAMRTSEISVFKPLGRSVFPAAAASDLASSTSFSAFAIALGSNRLPPAAVSSIHWTHADAHLQTLELLESRLEASLRGDIRNHKSFQILIGWRGIKNSTTSEGGAW